MKQKTSRSKFSLNSIFKVQSDSFIKSKHKILFIVFILTFIKGIIALCTAAYFNQEVQMLRALVYLTAYQILFYCFLRDILSFKFVAHTIIIAGLILVYSNLFLIAGTLNIVTMQFVFSIILSSFYILNSRYGILYSVLAIIPAIVFLLMGSKFNTYAATAELASPGYEIIVIVNFITIIYIPYLFYESFVNTVVEKEDLNTQLQKAVKMANDAVQAKSNFLSTMSHELRTPLNTVIGTTDLLLADKFEAHQEENLKDLKFSANTLLLIINDILDYNKLESSKLSLENIKVDLAKLLHTVCSGLNKQAYDKNIGLKLHIDPKIDEFDVVTDPTRIAQILYNLIGNAIKFTAVGEVSVSLNVTHQTEEQLSVRFSVADTGIGIETVQQQSIFEPFSQASNSITRQFGGTGLGLSIVKRLVTLFNSKIVLESSPQKGSDFSFEIQFEYHPKTEKLVTRQSLEVIAPKNLSDLKILVAEDNLMNRVLIQKVLAKWENQPVFAENGEEAINIALKQKFDVILMDLHMPLVDGYLAAKTIKENRHGLNYETPIIAFTASISEEILSEVNACGMIDFIYKPFDANDMYSKLRNLYPIAKK
ncbi:MAG TPA: ATP-binding protein [Pelobium sp.]